MNPCQTWQDQLWFALDGELDEAASATLVAHVRGCSACCDELNRAIRVQRALLMDTVGITGSATGATVALSAVRESRPSSGTQRVKPARVVHATRTTRRRVSSNRFIMPVAVLMALMMLGLIISGPGMTRVVPESQATSLPPPPVRVTRSTPVGTPSADALARLTQAVGVRVAGHAVASGAAVEADAPVEVEGSARLLMNDGTTLQLTSGTQLTLHRGGHRRGGGAIGVQVLLTSGTIDAEVTPQRAASPLAVTSPVAEVTVVGTALQFRHDAAGSRIQVTHGQVRVAIEGQADRLLGEGESLMVPSVSSALVLASFVVTEAMNHNGVVPQWYDPSTLDPRQRVVAEPSAGEQPPHYKVVRGHPALCVDGTTTSLTCPLPTWNPSTGLTMFIVALPLGNGSEGIERLASLSDASGERLAVVRSGTAFGLATSGGATAGKTVFEETDSGAMVLTCTWSRDGAVTLLHDHRVVASAAAAAPGTLTDAVLDIARGPQGKRFEGDIFLIEVQQGVLAEVALHQRIDHLMRRYGVSP